MNATDYADPVMLPADPVAPPPIADPVAADPVAAPGAVTPEVLDPEPPLGEQALARQADSLVTRAKALQIIDAESFELAGAFLQDLKDQQRRIEEFFEPDVQRAHAAWKGLTEKRASFVTPLKEAITIISARYAQFAREAKAKADAERRQREEDARKAEQERLAEEARAREDEARKLAEQALAAPSRDEAQIIEQQAEQLAQEATQLRVDAATVQAPVMHVAPVVSPPKGTSVKANWTFRVDDKLALVKAIAAGQVSVEAIVPNDTYLRARAKADKDTVKIPGVTFYDAGSVAVRRGR